MAGGTLLWHVRGDQSIGTSTYDAYYAKGTPTGYYENPNSGSGVSHAANAGGYGTGNNVYSFTATWAWLIWQGYNNTNSSNTGFTVVVRIIPRFTGGPAGDTCLFSMGSNTLYINGLKIEWLGTSGKIKLTTGDYLGFGNTVVTSTNAFLATSGTAREIGVTWDGTANAGSLKLYVDRVLDSSYTPTRVAPPTASYLSTIMVGRDMNGVDPYQNFDLNEAIIFSGVDSVVTDARSTFYSSTQFNGSNSVSAGAGNIKSGVTEIINGATITGTYVAPYTAASNVRSGADRGDGTLGTLIVPLPSNVVAGVPTDNTVGTYAGATQASVDALTTKITELYQITGLDAANPMTVTPTSRKSGAVNLKLTGDGVSTTTVTRQ